MARALTVTAGGVQRSLNVLLKDVCTCVRHAGETLRAELRRSGGPRGRGSHADVDAEIERYLQQKLMFALPCGYLGEELGAVRSRSLCTWVVDPNDGTSSYLRGLRGPAVSVALLRSGVPILGVVYSYRAPDDAGTMFAWADGCGPVRVDGAEAPPLQTALAPSHTVAVSQDAERNPRANAALCAPAGYIATPSIAYRLALVAAGQCAAGVSLSHVSAWDVAAGSALLRGAGGTLVDGNGVEVRYARDGALIVTGCGCVGGSVRVATELAARDWRACLLPASHPAARAARRKAKKIRKFA